VKIKKGFTLVELLAIVIIIALLLTVPIAIQWSRELHVGLFDTNSDNPNNKNCDPSFNLKEYSLSLAVTIVIATCALCGKIFYKMFDEKFKAENDVLREEIGFLNNKTNYQEKRIEKLEQDLLIFHDEIKRSKIILP
jgi:hypothetical protein